MSLVAITVLDKMEAILNLAALLDLRKLAKPSYHLSQWIFTDIKSEKHLEKGRQIIVLVAYTILDKMAAVLDLAAILDFRKWVKWCS